MERPETENQTTSAGQSVPESEKKLSYEEAVAELESIVKSLERGEAKLEESGKLYERGVFLSRYCSHILNEMEEKITELRVDDEGGLTEFPLNQV